MGIHHSRLTKEASSSVRNLLHLNENKLLSLLYNQEWDRVLERVKKYPREAKTPFVLHKQSIYPLHAACALREIPLFVIQALVEADPEGPTRFSVYDERSIKPAPRVRSYSTGDAISTASTGGDTNSSDSWNTTSDGSGGWLPLDVAVYYGVLFEIVEFLLQQYPAAVAFKNGHGMLPLHLAVSNTVLDLENTLQVVQLLLESFPESRYIPSSGKEGKTALEMVMDSKELSRSNKEALVEVLNQSISSSTSIPRVIQSISLENDSFPPPRPRPISLHVRARSASITGSITGGPASPNANTTTISHLAPGNSSLLATKLSVALCNQAWDDALKRLEKKPTEAQVWTLSNDTNGVDPPCHALPINIALRRKAPLNVVAALLKEFPDATKMREYYGMLPLHVACQFGASLQVVNAIYEAYKEAVQVQDLQGMLPLHLACSSEACRCDVILLLLDAYPESLNVHDDKNMLAVEYARNGQHPHSKKLQGEFGRGLDYWAAPTDLVLIQHLLHQRWEQAMERAESHPQEASVWTKHPIHGKRRYALHYACKYKAPPALVKVLLEAHAEAAQVAIDDYQLLPLHLACSHGAADEVVKMLLETYIEAASIPDSLGLLPLHLAITEGASLKVVEYLLEAYPNARKMPDSKGFVPYVYAESSHHPSSRQVMELLDHLSLNNSSEASGTKRPSLASNNNKHGRDATSALLQTKRQKSDRSLQAATKVIAPIMVE